LSIELDGAGQHASPIVSQEAPLPVLPFLLWPAVAVLFSAVIAWNWPLWQKHLGVDHLSSYQKLADAMPLLLLLAGITLLVIRLTLTYAQVRSGHRPPKLVRQIVSLLAVTIGAGIAVATLWDVPVGSLLTTSGLLVAVVGIALKNMISDLFNGISMPVKIGDWVDVAGFRGRVTEISWRATKLIGNDGVVLVIPNTHFITHPIRNFSSDHGYYIDQISITLPVSVTAYQAERILVGAAQQVDVIANLLKLPEARILSFNSKGVEWELRFPIPDAGMSGRLRHQVQRIMMRDLYYSGIDLPVAQVEIHQPPRQVERPQREEIIFLNLIDLFGTLTQEELTVVSDLMRPRLLRAGAAVVKQGEAGDSLFIVQEGLLAASVNTERGETELGKIRPGQFFGEMSLLTGAARSATVTPLVDSKAFEIDRDILAPILLERPEIAALMSRVLAERQLANAPKLDSPAQMVAAQEGLAQQILGRITTFFRLPPRAQRLSQA